METAVTDKRRGKPPEELDLTHESVQDVIMDRDTTLKWRWLGARFSLNTPTTPVVSFMLVVVAVVVVTIISTAVTLALGVQGPVAAVVILLVAGATAVGGVLAARRR